MRNCLLFLWPLSLLLLGPPAETPDQVATITVADEQFHVRLTEPEDIAGAYRLLAGRSDAAIPVGEIVPGSGGVNTGYSWHLDPEEFDWEEYAIAMCDGLPSQVERGMLNDRFCPWSAKLVDLRPADRVVGG